MLNKKRKRKKRGKENTRVKEWKMQDLKN